MQPAAMINMRSQKILVGIGFSFTAISLLFMDVWIRHALGSQIQQSVIAWSHAVLSLLGGISYYRAIFTDPGTPPKRQPDPKRRLPICYSCQNWRPPRTYHCVSCDRCVLRMDHHCPWIANCVGFYNIKYFFLMGFYLTTAGLIYFCAAVYFLFFVPDPIEYLPPSVYGFYLFLSLIISASVFSLWFLTIQYFAQFCQNISTMERFSDFLYVNPLTWCCVKKDKSLIPISYDLGIIYNIEQVLGKHFLFWFFPMTSYKTFGYEFKQIPSLNYSHNMPIALNKRNGLPYTVDEYLEDTNKFSSADIDYESLIEINT